MPHRSTSISEKRQLAEGKPPASAVPAPTPRSDDNAPRERVNWVDWSMLVLAVMSLLLLIAEETLATYLGERPDVARWLIIADLTFCGLFAVEFLARMRGQPNKWAYTKSRWYDLLGMVPVSHPFFRSFRLVRVLRVVVITSRFVRATNRSFGEMAFEATVLRFKNILVELIADAVVLRSIGMVQPWLVRARFAERIGEALDERRGDIHTMIQDNMDRVPGNRLLRMRPMRGVMESAETAAVQAVIDTLKSDELNQLVQEASSNIIEELKEQVKQREYATEPPAE